ncbi:MAG: hypothetical protein JXR96_04720 [Deltaproteobacteria bacterium]|nr:hypothetical protein [Deltaproteobacteria bacterium]
MLSASLSQGFAGSAGFALGWFISPLRGFRASLACGPIQLLALALAVSACSPQGSPLGDPSGRGKALVITTDYQDGATSLVDMRSLETWRSLERIHPDAVCRYDPRTRTPYVVSRMGADAVALLDPDDGWRVCGEYSVGAGSNPQDIGVISAERAYVLRYADPALSIVHPSEGTELGTLDLGAWADADGVPEAAWALVHEESLFVSLQRLTDFQPAGYSSLLVLDGARGEVEREIRLSAPNPFAPLRYVPELDRVAVIEAGVFGELDGGIELLPPGADGPAGLAVREQDLGGDLVDAELLDGQRGYAILGVPKSDSQMRTRLVRFDPSGAEPLAVLLDADDYDYSFLTLSPDRSQLWVCDRNREAPGVRIIDTRTDAELSAQPIDTGLPPYMICFVPED